MARIHSFITSRRRGADRVDEEGWVLVTYPEEEEEQKPTEEKDDRSQDYWRFSTGSSIGIGWGQVSCQSFSMSSISHYTLFRRISVILAGIAC